MIKKTGLAIFIGLLFFIAQILTLQDYNIMWDARGHFLRGQSYANLYLTGKETYDEPISKAYVRYYRDYISRSTPGYEKSFYVPSDSYRKSIYKDPFHGFKVYKNDLGHPSFSDIGAAIFNIVLYEKLGLVKDDLAYGLFAIFLSAVLVALVFSWVRQSYGSFAAIVSTLVLGTYPLFWAESHFNIKDVPEVVFFSLTIWAFWVGISKQLKKWIIISSIFGGFALGTKFNIVFLPFILIPWFIVFYLGQSKESRRKYHAWWWFLFVYPLIIFSIFFATYPYIWQDPLGNFLNVISFYKNIGLNIDYTPQFRTFFGFNTYPLIWIAITTYPWVLFLSLIGSLIALFKFFKSKDTLPLLFLLWFLVPIVRVSLPKSAIYDGVRQIMEFIPAMAILAGIGADKIAKFLNGYIAKRFKQFNLLQIGILLLFIPLILILIRLHPAENAYFNSLIGGLKGAKENHITGWGNTDGGIYRKALVWLNKNAEPNAHIAVGFSETADFYLPEFREDLRADNQFSGYLQKGEYIVALTHNSELEYTYRMMYPERFLEPVYIYEVDGVPLIKIWKNDTEHLKKEIQKLQKITVNPIARVENARVYWDLGGVKQLNYIEITFEQKLSCAPLSLAYFQISKDKEHWETLPETYPGSPIDVLGKQPDGNRLIAPFAGQKVRFIQFTAEPEDSCVMNIWKSIIEVFE